ncbi:MAG TPA: M20 family peptidase, partial [Thermoanaerobaculia bacterium]|nr:M20 family peptidase [Thermoanaerobaculia bacterium]
MRLLPPLLAVALAISAAAPCAAEALSPAEQRLVEQIDARIDPALELLERTVNVNSGTMNFA